MTVNPVHMIYYSKRKVNLNERKKYQKILDSKPGSGCKVQENLIEGVDNMRISEAALITGLSVSNIRFYEKKGLLAPVREEESRYRDYSEEDIRELKRIILYRKMSIPVETIYLMQQGEISLDVVLKRQEEELYAQREMLQGSIDLCQKLLSRRDTDDIDVDYYLNYVKEEEEKGRHFAEVEELLEDFAEFAGMSPYGPHPMAGGFFINRKVRLVCSLALLICCALSLPLLVLESYLENGMVRASQLVFWGVWLLGLTASFLVYKKSKK